MEQLVTLVEGSSYGYLVLAGIGFAEYAGLPIVSVPVLVAAGALTTTTWLAPVPVAASAAAGGLAADLLWYGLGRWQGRRLVGVACNLSSSPGQCVVDVEERLRKVGLGLVVPSKFLPGVGNLLAPAAGFARLDAARFVGGDTVALALWAGAYTGLGVLFAGQVETVLDWIAAYRGWAVFAAGFAIGAAVVWRRLRSRRHEGGHRAAMPGPDGPEPGEIPEDGSGNERSGDEG